MKMIPSRELSARPSAVWKKLKTEGSVVVTRDGQPIGIITPTSASTLLEDMQEVVFARARRAVTDMRRTAAERKVDKLSMKEIDAEIQNLRKTKRSAHSSHSPFCSP